MTDQDRPLPQRRPDDATPLDPRSGDAPPSGDAAPSDAAPSVAAPIDDSPTEVGLPATTPASATPPFVTEPTAPAGDDAVAAAPTSTVVTPSAPRRGRGRLIAAIAASAVVVAIAATATILLTGAAPASKTLAWTPPDSVMVMEARLDLPGGQRQALGEFLSKFPGFDDQAILDTKIGEVLDRFMREASDGRYDYRTDIDPWFGGEIAMSFASLPTSEDDLAKARFIVLLSVDDGAAATAWFDAVVADGDGATATTEHGGVTITTIDPDDGEETPVEGGYAAFGPVIALGDLASIKAAIDTKGASTLAQQETFKAALATLPADRLGFFFVDATSLPDLAEQLGGMEGTDAVPIPSLPAVLDELAVPWTAAAFRVEGDALVVDGRAPHVATLAGAPANRTSSLAALVPADTLVLSDGRDVGAGLTRLFDLLKTDPDIAAGFADVESSLAMLGGLEGMTGWLGDAGFVLVPEGDSVAGGIVITPTDRAGADRLLTTLRSALALGGGQLGISVRDDEHGDATVTVITVEDLPALIALAGGLDPSGAVPDTSGLPQTLELAYTVTDDIVVLGSSPTFVKKVLDAPAGDSLAEEPRFAALVTRAGAENSGVFWIDVRDIRGLVEPLIPSEERGTYDTELKPYVEAFDAILGTGVAGADIDRSTFFVTVSE